MNPSPVVDPSVAPTDNPPTVAHYVRKADAIEGYVMGVPVTALCGASFVPSRDPEPLPVCDDCTMFVELFRS